MKLLVTLIGVIAVVNSAIIPQNQQVNIPIEKTSIVGPSGSITQVRNFLGEGNVDNTLKLQTPVEVSNVVGPSGSIRQEKYLQTSDSFASKTLIPLEYGPPVVRRKEAEIPTQNDDCEHEEHKENTSNNKVYHHVKPDVFLQLKSPVLVQYKFPTKTKFAHSTNIVNQPKEKTTIVGLSGEITQEVQQSYNKFSVQNHNIVKTIPSAAKPVYLKYGYGVQNVAIPHVQNIVSSPVETTRIVGPSGSITQEIQSNQAPLAVQPVAVQYGLSPVVQVPQSHGTHIVSEPFEKTTIIGPSGLISKEVSSNSNEYFVGNHNIVKIDSAAGKPVIYNYEKPSLQTVAVPINTRVFSGHSEKTSVVGPSGSITQEIQSNQAPLAVQPVAVQYGLSPVVQVPHYYGTHIVSEPIEKTTIIGPNGLIRKEVSSNGNEHFVGSHNIVKINSAAGKPVVYNYEKPSVQTVAVPINTEVVGGQSEKTSVVGPSGSITQEIRSNSNGNVAGVHKFVSGNLVASKPVAALYSVPSIAQASVSYYNNIVSTPSEKTSIIGPSGSITREITPSIQRNNLEILNVLKNTPSVAKPVIVQYGLPSIQKIPTVVNTEVGQHVDKECDEAVEASPAITGFTSPVVASYGYSPSKYVTFVNGNHLENSPVEKTSIVGPSGSINQERYSSPNFINEHIGGVDYTFKNSPVYVTPVGYGLGYQNVDVTYGTHVQAAPIKRTSVVGPSGSITQEVNLPTATHAVSNIPVAIGATADRVEYTSPVVVRYGLPSYAQQFSVNQESNIPIEQTKIIGPSGLITNERYLPSTKFDYAIISPPTQVQVKTPVAVSYGPSPSSFSIVENNVEDTPFYGAEKTSIVGPSGSITHERNSKSTVTYKTGANDVVHVANVQNYGSYAPIPAYPNVAAPDC